MQQQLSMIGQRIKKFRTEKNLSQSELSEMSNVAKNYISLVENGSANISINKLAAICSALDITLGDVFPPATRVEGSELDEVMSKVNTLPERERTLVMNVIEKCARTVVLQVIDHLRENER